MHNNTLFVSKISNLDDFTPNVVFCFEFMLPSKESRMHNKCGGVRWIKENEVCENSTEYLFFDSFHPNEVVSRHTCFYMSYSNNALSMVSLSHHIL